jgi:hypothetical protein
MTVVLEAIESIDGWFAGLATGAPLVVTMLVALGLGVRHASDPDHLLAVASLAGGDHGPRAAAWLGTCWGLGHCAVLLAVGLPILLAGSYPPGWLEHGAEQAVGALLIVLGLRVLLRRPAVGGDAPPARTARQAFVVGVVHGLAGTGAVTLLVLAAIPAAPAAAAMALGLFAIASLASMAACSATLGWALSRSAIAVGHSAIALPALGALGLAIGCWYLAAA